MSEKQPIHDRKPEHPPHPGRHSFTRRLQEATGKLREWRNQRVISHEEGHTPEPLGEEIDLFPQADEKTLPRP